MDDNIIETMIRDKSEITVEKLETIRIEEREDPSGMENAKSKILAALESGSYNFRNLRRKSHVRGKWMEKALDELVAENKVKVIEVK